jgi:2-polyprenyl-6-methoxyphenol hydroxylase-like FAD-dependent oxidoreductase
MDMVGVRTMEFCRRWGIAQWVESAGYNRAHIQDCAWVSNLNGFEFGREPFPAPQDELPPVESPQKRERCPQNFFDPVLARFARETGKTDIRYQTELLSFEDLGDRVKALLRRVDTGAECEVECDFLVGADGAGSTVRTQLGIDMSGDGVLTYTTNAIFRHPDLPSLHHMKPAYRYIFIGPEGTWATLVAIDGRDHWRFSLVGDESKRKVSEDDMRAAIIRAVGVDFEFEILSMLPWVRRQLVADSYGEGRVHIVGDAAHMTSPTGGFGMNTGILDAVNLSWKLAALLDGWGGSHLLQSYEREQKPVAIRNVTEAGDNLRRMLSPRVLKPAPEVFAGGPDAEAARREYGERYTEMMRKEWCTIGIHLGYVYDDSNVIVPDGTAACTPAVSTYEPTARPGSRAPHVWLGPDRSLIDEFGVEFVLLRFDNSVDTSELLHAARAAGVPLRMFDVDNAEAAELYQRRLVLVRPDGQVAWRGDSIGKDAAGIVEVVRGAAPPSDGSGGNS